MRLDDGPPLLGTPVEAGAVVENERGAVAAQGDAASLVEEGRPEGEDLGAAEMYGVLPYGHWMTGSCGLVREYPTKSPALARAWMAALAAEPWGWVP